MITHAPIELVIADSANLVFLVLGSIFLLKFLMKLGSERAKKYSMLMCAAIIAYALFHEGAEIIHNIYVYNTGITETAITSAISITYVVAALLLRKEIKSIVFSGVRKHGK